MSSAAEMRIVVAPGGNALIRRGEKLDANFLALESASCTTLSTAGGSVEQADCRAAGGNVVPAGSMALKVEGCRRYAAATRGSATIGALSDAVAMRAGTAGTTISGSPRVIKYDQDTSYIDGPGHGARHWSPRQPHICRVDRGPISRASS